MKKKKGYSTLAKESTERRKQDIRDRLDQGDKVVQINTHRKSGGEEIWESDGYPVYYKCYWAVRREREK